MENNIKSTYIYLLTNDRYTYGGRDIKIRIDFLKRASIARHIVDKFEFISKYLRKEENGISVS